MRPNLPQSWITIFVIFGLTSCTLLSYPGYSDNFGERYAQVVADEQNPQNKTRRKLLYIHKDDTCNDIEKFYHESHDRNIALELATQKRCGDLVREIKHDKLMDRKMLPTKEDERYTDYMWKRRMQEQVEY